MHDLGGQLGVVVVGVVLGVDGAELVAAVLHHEEGLRDGVPSEGEDVPMAGGVVEAVGLRLVRLVGVEAPEAAVRLQELRGVLSLGAPGAVGIAVGIGGRADLHEEAAGLVEGEGLGIVLLSGGEGLDHGLRLPCGRQLPRGEAVAIDGGGGRVIEPPVTQRDARASPRAESLLDVGPAVTVGVAQRDDADLAGLDVDVPVRGDGEEAQGPEVVGDHDRPKARGELDAPVVRIRDREPGADGGSGDDEREEEQSFHGEQQSIHGGITYRVGPSPEFYRAMGSAIPGVDGTTPARPRPVVG